jgi:hypothetical protein
MKAKRQLLKEQWMSYRNEVMPTTAPRVQVTECRRAFYSGALAFLHITMGHFESGADETTPGDISLMEGLDEELHEFAEQIRNGTA